MFPAVFIDRDGVIIAHRPNYVLSWADVEIYPQALLALARCANSAYRFVIVTNQSCIGRQLISRPVADEINRRLLAEIRRVGGRIDGIFVCPHTPDNYCDCRKPQPGLILQAALELDIDLRRSIMIGDALTDLQAGLNAGVGQIALVRTGRGRQQEKDLQATDMPPFLVYDTLREALDNLVRSCS